MLPFVELTNMTTCSFDSTDSSILNLLNTNSHVCDFKIPLKGVKSSSLEDLYAVTCFNQFLIVDLLFWQMLIELESTETSQISQE